MRARHPSSRSKRKPFKPFIIEHLEPRRLLTTLTGGGVVAGAPVGSAPFYFEDGQGNIERIVLFGNITAEVIGANVSATNVPTLINLPPVVLGDVLPAVPPADSIFAIYVSSSDFTGGIAVEQVPFTLNAGGAITRFGAGEPLNGSIGGVRVNNAQNGMLNLVAAPGGTGVCYLGARTIVPTPAPANPVDNEPILQLPVTQQFGVLPGSFLNSELNAGLIVAPDNSMGNFIFGGTVTGQVSIGGSIDKFYCGWLITGNTSGEAGTNDVTVPQNFTVLGNIRKLQVAGSIGTDSDAGLQNPTYVSGFDMYAAGTVGLVQSYQGSIIGSVNAANLTGLPTDGTAQVESEDYGAANEFAEGGITNGIFDNNTFATAQYISNAYNAAAGTDDSVVVDGTLEATTPNPQDRVDYYAVPLMAGQTITVQVQDLVVSAADPQGVVGDLGDINVGVFDPDGREIATDYNATAPAATQEKPFQFTADRPGVYRFAVAPTGDTMFAGNGPFIGDVPYQLSIQNVGHMAIGAIVAANNILDNPAAVGGGFGFGGGFGGLGFANAGFGTQSDDIGAIVAGGNILSTSQDAISVEDGSLRCIEAGTIGTGTTGTDPDISVPNGNVGLVESTAGNLYFNDDDLLTAIGGDYQVVSSAGDLEAQLIADGNIGTVRAASVGANTGVDLTEFKVDANNASNNGTIDLIDCAGNYGNGAAGGAPIYTGPGGHMGYLIVGGTVFGDANFGNILTPRIQNYPINYPARIVDSSGAVITLTPVPTNMVQGPTLTVETYPLEDGGSSIISVTSTGGLNVTASGSVPNQIVDIGNIDVQGDGNAVLAGLTSTASSVLKLQTVPLPAPPTLAVTDVPLDMIFSGNTQINAFNVTGGEFNEIANDTPGGEIVTVNATSIGTLTGSGAVGINLAHSTAAALLPTNIISNAYPFNGLRTGVNVTGSIVTVSLPVVGNLIVGGSVGTLSGPIEGAVTIAGSVNAVNFQSGIYPSGTGNMANAGLFVTGVIGNVSNSQPGDIRGNVLSNSGIISVHVNNGSIINAAIGNPTNFFSASNLNTAFINVFDAGGNYLTPILDIGSISTTGNGGIIGCNIITSNLGTLTSQGGFGIFETTIGTTPLGSVGVVTTDGYGARGFTYVGGSTFGALIARGNGSLESTANFSKQVQYSETSAFDPFFGTVPNALTDIDAYLGTSAAEPVIPGVTDTGIVENTELIGSRTLRSVNCYEIRSTDPVNTPDIFNFANNIVNISTRGPIDGLDITTGKLTTLQTNGNLMHTTVTIAGRITRLIIRANLTDSSSIVALGRNGNIGNLRIYGNMDGVIQADGGKIGTVRIYGNLFGQIKTKSITDLILYKSLGDGSLDITGSAGTIQFLGDLGNPGDTLTVGGKVNILKVGGDLTANVAVGGSLNQLQVKGSIVSGSKVTVGTVLNLMKVGADFQAGAIVQAHAVKKVKIGGLNAGSIVIV